MTAGLLVRGAGVPLSPALLPRLGDLIATRDVPLSEYSLANLFLFRGRHDYSFHEAPIPHVRGRTYDGEHHALPLADLDRETATALLEEVDCIAPLGADAPALAGRWGLACDWREADSDYAYDAARLATLTGAKAKRAQARAFEAAEAPEALSLTGDKVALARKVLDGWRVDVGRDDADTDYRECLEALDMRERLGIEGLVTLAQGRPVAFLLAGPAADGSRIVHFAKGRRAFAGAYPWMFARYARSVGTGRINFEQDMGKPGFAQAKRAFAPVARLPKYRMRKP